MFWEKSWRAERVCALGQECTGLPVGTGWLSAVCTPAHTVCWVHISALKTCSKWSKIQVSAHCFYHFLIKLGHIWTIWCVIKTHHILNAAWKSSFCIHKVRQVANIAPGTCSSFCLWVGTVSSQTVLLDGLSILCPFSFAIFPGCYKRMPGSWSSWDVAQQ